MVARMRSAALAVAVLSAGFALAAPAAHARDGSVTSFDGTNIVLSFFPAANLPAGKKAPTVLFGPGWSSGRTTDENSATDTGAGAIGVGPLRAAGYNVLTWDPRGFGSSGGTATVDSPDAEGRDVQELIDFVAAPARGAARQGRRPARRHDRRLLRRRHPARHGGAGHAPRRDRARHRLALARDEPLQGLDRQDRLVEHPLHDRQGPRPPGPAHRLAPSRRARPPAASRPTTSRGSARRGPGDLVDKITDPDASSSRAPSTRSSRSTRRSPTTGSCGPTGSRRRCSGSAAATARA